MTETAEVQIVSYKDFLERSKTANLKLVKGEVVISSNSFDMSEKGLVAFMKQLALKYKGKDLMVKVVYGVVGMPADMKAALGLDYKYDYVVDAQVSDLNDKKGLIIDQYTKFYFHSEFQDLMVRPQRFTVNPRLVAFHLDEFTKDKR